MRTAFILIIIALSLGVAISDIYLQGCGLKGSNNRISASNNQNNRLFDSQNNNAGGYGLHPKMKFYAGSQMQIQWTSQHGCGTNPNVQCNYVLQYMCGDSPAQVRNGRVDQRIEDGDADIDGKLNETVTDLDDDNNCDAGDNNGDNCDGNGGNQPVTSQTGDMIDPEEVIGNNEVYRYGQHESYEYYQECKTRKRNAGLFTADDAINDNRGATATRQNPGGNNNNNNGWECPEERDYYPYWHPSPWVDIAVLTDNVTMCDYYRAESQNTKAVNRCSIPTENNAVECEKEGGTWETVPAKGMGQVDCLQTAFSRDNHLGNAGTMTAAGVKTPFYVWTIPEDVHDFCVFRIRYNISSADYNGWEVDSDYNDGQSPITDDPVKLIGNPERNVSVRINVNVNQFGRTFQDRSHVFAIKPRPDDIPSDRRIFNVNVRGERGNIVQTYPATEYDFCPTSLDVSRGDYLHFQFAGTDTNQNNQAGNGKNRTDRTNVVELADAAANYPVEYTGNPSLDSKFFFTEEDANLMGFLGQEGCDEEADPNNDNDDENCFVLNRAPRYFEKLHKVEANEGTYHFASTRNNDFTNRSHKMTLNVSPAERASAFVAMLF